MKLTTYHIHVLRNIRKHQPIRNADLAKRCHPSYAAEKKAQAMAMTGKAVSQLESAEMVECSNFTIQSWKITEKGLKKLETK